MTANTATTTPDFYGIVKAGPVKAFVNALSSNARDAINNVIDDFQSNPRPPGYEATDIDPQMLYFLVDTINPKYTITYKIDDEKERVLIYSIYETNFRHR